MPKPAKTDLSVSGAADAQPSPEMVRVWDRVVRSFHWALVLSFVTAWLTSHSSEDIHHWAGYAAAALVAMRLLWGVLGTPYARFSQFVRDPATVLHYLSAMLSGREARYIGHNPAGGAMVIVLIAAMGSTALTGWLMTTDAYFGVSVGRNGAQPGCARPAAARLPPHRRRRAGKLSPSRKPGPSHDHGAKTQGRAGRYLLSICQCTKPDSHPQRLRGRKSVASWFGKGAPTLSSTIAGVVSRGFIRLHGLFPNWIDSHLTGNKPGPH